MHMRTDPPLFPRFETLPIFHGAVQRRGKIKTQCAVQRPRNFTPCRAQESRSYCTTPTLQEVLRNVMRMNFGRCCSTLRISSFWRCCTNAMRDEVLYNAACVKVVEASYSTKYLHVLCKTLCLEFVRVLDNALFPKPLQ